MCLYVCVCTRLRVCFCGSLCVYVCVCIGFSVCFTHKHTHRVKYGLVKSKEIQLSQDTCKDISLNAKCQEKKTEDT